MHINGNFIIGLLLLLAGTSILIKIFFHIDIPIFKLFLGLLLIWAGISFMIGSCSCSIHWESPEEQLGEEDFEDHDDGSTGSP